MKIIFVLLLAVVLTTSYAVTLKAKAKAVLKKLSEEVDQPSYKQVFKSLLELTATNEYDEVYDILRDVRGEISASLASAEQKLLNENQAFNDQTTQYNGALTVLDDQESDNEQELNVDTTRRDSLQVLIQQAVETIAEAEGSISNEQARRQRNNEANQDKLQDLSSAIAECDQIVTVLKQVDENDERATGSAFLEVRKKRVQNSLKLIEEKITKTKIVSPTTSFIHALVKISQNGVNQAQIEQIIELIIDLKRDLQEESTETNEEERDDANASASLIANKQSTIDVQDQLRDNAEANLVTTVAEIDDGNERATTLRTNIQQFNDLLNALEQVHTVRVRNLNDLVDRLTRDVAALDQALTFLDTQRS